MAGAFFWLYMTRLLKHKPDDEAVNWQESDHQIYLVQWLRRNGFTVAADQNGATNQRRSQRLAEGMQPGEPDLRIYRPEGKLVMIELKRHKGKVSAHQAAYHELLRELGYEVHVIQEKTPTLALKKLIDILG